LKSMLPHKKAIPRIAFLAGEKTNFEIDLQVIPVGIYYSHYYNFRSDLVVQYGTPISMKKYFEIYRTEGELKATQVLKDKIYAELSKLCVNVPDKEDYEIYEQGFEINRLKVCEKLNLKTSPLNLVKAEQTIVQKLKVYLDEHLSEKEELLKTAISYKKLKNKFDLNELSLIKGEVRWLEFTSLLLLFLITLPFSLFGVTLNGWVFWVSNYQSRKKIKDPQFYSTFSLSISVILFSFWSLILFLIFTFLLKSWLTSIILVLISFPCGIIAWDMVQLFLRIYNRLKCVRLKNSSNSDYKRLLENRSLLTSKFDKILN
jgi:hypothetical protein